MTPEVQRHVALRAAGAPILLSPFPHIYATDVFPADFYAALQRNLPESSAMSPIGEVRPVRGYNERFVLDIRNAPPSLPEAQLEFWRETIRGLCEGHFRATLLSMFRPWLFERFKGEKVRLFDEAMLVEDITNYALGPHTDAPTKVVTVLFYLPPDLSQVHLGTSLYVPKDPDLRCVGGPHYRRDDFELVATMPFKPNSMFAFVKGDRSFHGVEPVLDPDIRRWLLLYDIKYRPGPIEPA